MINGKYYSTKREDFSNNTEIGGFPARTKA